MMMIWGEMEVVTIVERLLVGFIGRLLKVLVKELVLLTVRHYMMMIITGWEWRDMLRLGGGSEEG